MVDDVGIARISRWVFDYDADVVDIPSVLSKNVPNWDKMPQETRDKISDIGKSTSEVDYVRKTFEALPTREIDSRTKQLDKSDKPSFFGKIAKRIKGFFVRS